MDCKFNNTGIQREIDYCNGGEFDEATGYKKDRRSLWSAYELRNFITDEYTLTLRLESELSELRVGYANRYSVAKGGGEFDEATSHQNRKRHHECGVLFW